MSTLIKLGPDGWQASTAHAVVDWKTADEWKPGEALALAGDAELQADYVKASAIAIEFPAFTDGRGLSLAVLIRTRLQYTGELRACGDTHEDLVHYLARCGFDVIELPAERNVDTALDLIEPYSVHYQASVNQPEPAFTRVQRGL